MKDNTFRYCPCGKCEACRSLKSYQWKKRLDSEMSCNSYTLAFTLTYDEAHRPNVLVDSNTGHIDYCHFEDKPTLFAPPDVVASLSKYKLRRDGKYLVPVVCHYDIKEFIKRLKVYAPHIRWFIQSEIGPTTLRPHYHGLLFFSLYEPEYIKSCIYKAWPKCNWSLPEHQKSIHTCNSTAYCTAYVASVLVLPKFHNYGRFAQFHYASTRPPIGELSYSSDDLRKYATGDTIEVSRYDIKSNEYSVVPFLRSMEDKHFPKLPNYGLLNDSARKLLLKSYLYFAPNRQIIIHRSKVYRFGQYAERFSRFIENHPIFYELCSPALSSDSSLYRIYRASRTYCRKCVESHPLFVDYCYDLHCYKVEMAKLRSQYLYEEDFCNRRGLSPRWLIFKDLEFVKTYQDSFGFVDDWVEYTLNGYGYDDIDDFNRSWSYYVLSKNSDCQAYFDRIHNIIHESHKSKANRSYQYQAKIDYLDNILDSQKNYSSRFGKK